MTVMGSSQSGQIKGRGICPLPGLQGLVKNMTTSRCSSELTAAPSAERNMGRMLLNLCQ